MHFVWLCVYAVSYASHLCICTWGWCSVFGVCVDVAAQMQRPMTTICRIWVLSCTVHSALIVQRSFNGLSASSSYFFVHLFTFSFVFSTNVLIYVSTIALILYRIIQNSWATANKHRVPLHTWVFLPSRVCCCCILSFFFVFKLTSKLLIWKKRRKQWENKRKTRII